MLLLSGVIVPVKVAVVAEVTEGEVVVTLGCGTESIAVVNVLTSVVQFGLHVG